MQVIRFKPDASVRRRFFHPDSLRHPAKMACGLVFEILDRYTKPGDWIADPMAGSGTLLLGAMLGRNLILGELEMHFLVPMLKSWAKIQQNGPALGYSMGKVLILRGDARDLPIASVDSIVTSPPGEDQEPFQDKEFNLHGTGPVKSTQPSATGYTRPVDVVLSSPPYEGVASRDRANMPYEAKRPREFQNMGASRHVSSYTAKSYTRPDAILTSPPFGEALSGGGIAVKGHFDDPGLAQRVYSPEVMKPGAKNIGDMRGQKYWGEEGMTAVYRECYRVLRQGGLMVLVLKGFTRDGVYQDLPSQTSELVQSIGFVPFDHWRRELYSLSFWRILQKRRSPETFDDRLNYEEVIAFRKPGEPPRRDLAHKP